MNKDIEIDIKEDNINIEIDKNEKVYVRDGTGTSNYNDLTNKPQINGVPLEGNKTSKDLGIKQEYTANDIAFEDGETFQEKYNKGELKGDTGESGPQGEPGTDGKQGPQGNPGPAGTDGENGFSPTVTTTSIENGTKIDITDVNGVKSFEVLNGKDGEQGLQGEKGEPGTDGKTPVKGVDYFTEADKQEFIEEVEQTLTPQFDNKLDIQKIQDLSSQTEVTIDKLESNTYYKLSSQLTSLTITALDENKCNPESILTFTAGSDIVVNVPSDIQFIGNNTFESEKTYVISIWNNIMVIGGIENV